MAEDQEKPSKARGLFPVGGAIAILMSQKPTPPALLFGDSAQMWTFIHAIGLLIGLGMGFYITNRSGRLQPKKKGLFVIGGISAALLALIMHYLHIRRDAENHAITITVEFSVIAIFVGILLFLVVPAVRFLTGREE